MEHRKRWVYICKSPNRVSYCLYNAWLSVNLLSGGFVIWRGNVGTYLSEWDISPPCNSASLNFKYGWMFEPYHNT